MLKNAVSVSMSRRSGAKRRMHSEVSGGGQAMGVIASQDAYLTVLDELKSSGAVGPNGVAYDPYGSTEVATQVLALLSDGRPVESAIAGDHVEVILASTPFYVESGGQVSDTGQIKADQWLMEVEDTRRPVGGLVVHIGEVIEGTPHKGDQVLASVDAERRADITRNHTATHLLHAALRNTLGTHVQQRGSLVAPDRLRFDFAHDGKISPEELRHIEGEVNDVILDSYPVSAEEKPLEQARGEGAMALFGEKYGDRVRTITVADNGTRYSYELCGGVHVHETGEIGQMLIVSEGSVSAGIRRIEALTGRGAREYVHENLDRLNHIAHQLGTTPEHSDERVSALQDELASSKKEIDKLRRDIARQRFAELIDAMEPVNGVPTLIAQLDEMPMDTLREMSDWFRNKVDSGVLVLGTVVNDQPQLLVAVTDDLTKQGFHAGNLIKAIARDVGGGGGGRPNLAQAGGKDASKLSAALDHAHQLIAESVQA